MRAIATGLAIGLDEVGVSFDPNKPFRACLLCGRVFQTEHDRAQTNPLWALENREAWARRHAKMHSAHEHMLLRQSGLSMTPEAAHKLAAYGIVPVVDMVMDKEVEIALMESSPVPENDADGSN